MTACTRCAGSGLDPVDAAPVDAAPDVVAMLADFRAACAANGMVVLPGERVRTDDAAALLDRAPRTLEGWRGQGTGPAYVRGLRPSYTLAALAAFEVQRRSK